MKNKPIIVDTTKSPYALLRPIPINSVKLRGKFWGPIQRRVARNSLPSQYQQLEITGRLANFDRVTKDSIKPFRGLYFDESDVYKWLEAAAYVLAIEPDDQLRSQVDETINKIIAIQTPDGYINAYFIAENQIDRWKDIKDNHELYCAGHLIQTAIALQRTIGEDALLQTVIRYADLIVETFGPDGPLSDAAPGHPEIEIALVELYRETGDERYLEQSLRFIDNRGIGYLQSEEYYQDHMPFRDLRRMYGHAVRAVYLNTGAADIFLESGNQDLLEALRAMWDHMEKYQVYLTGGVGSRTEGEAFGDDYELPDSDAYAETCAAIGKIFWAWRMLSITGDAKFADDIERTLYNAVMVGLGNDCVSYFYSNPLASNCMHRRQPWFAISCCPPNIARLLASMNAYLYSVSDNAIWVHQYIESNSKLKIDDGERVELEQITNYPWDGRIQIKVNAQAEFSLFVRIPDWCDSGQVIIVNGTRWTDGVVPQSYVEIHRQWSPGDIVELDLPMPVRVQVANPKIIGLEGRVALMRGPLVYCLESTDQPVEELDEIYLSDDFEFDIEDGQGIMKEMKVICGTGFYKDKDSMKYDSLYLNGNMAFSDDTKIKITAIPYFAWANRDYGEMRVWIRAR